MSDLVFAYNNTPAIIYQQENILSLLQQIKESQTIKFTKEITIAVKEQIRRYLQIEELDKERTKILEAYEVAPDNIKNEINKQRREVTKIPPLESLISIKNRIENKINPPASVDGKDTEDTKPPVVLEKNIRKILEISISQKELLIERAQAIADIIKVCAQAASEEPLFITLQKYSIDPTVIFGWGVYALAIKEYSSVQINKIKSTRNKIADFDKNNTSIGKFLKIKKGNESGEDDLLSLKQAEENYKLIQINSNRELNNIEKNMVDEFWDVYNKVAHLITSKKITGVDRVILKAFLRTGLLGYSERWIAFEHCKKILEECSTPLCKPGYSTKSLYLFYADEIIELSATGLIPPSPNEDLELNHRNTPEWRADRAYKKHIFLTIQEYNLTEIYNQQKEELFSIRDKQIEAEAHYTKIRGLRSKNEKTKSEANALRQNIQKYKVRSARLEKLIEKIELDILDRTREEIEITENNLRKAGVAISKESIVEHEVKTIRRNSRLVAKLKEPFLPFVLKEHYKPEQKNINDKDSLQELLTEAENSDPLVFSDKLIPTAKRIHRVLVRKSPIIMIAPARGILGFVVEPRTGVETGRIVLPGYYERATMKEEVLTTTLADFRFDNSKAEAGVDLMNSDTLVAAYSTYRWNMRKKDKDTRQKASVYLEENERTNWRRHYALYMKSAADNGRQLFYKCPDLYEIIINKFIDLPAGCVVLKH